MEEKAIGERLEHDTPVHVKEVLHQEARQFWTVMTLYERFEQIVALALSAIIIVIVVVAMFQLLRVVLGMMLDGTLHPLDPDTFQLVFGMMMTLLIALEFKHSIVKVALRRESIIQVKTVILIALLALARKFVVLDMDKASPAKIVALAGALLVLGIVYWLMRERDDAEERLRRQTGLH
jgi:uncharacterized membrane protein (DUF373 family)